MQFTAYLYRHSFIRGGAKNQTQRLPFLHQQQFQQVKKMLLIMRLTIILILAGCLKVSAGGYAQQITLKAKDMPCESVFKEITRQSGYQFFFNKRLIRNARKVSVELNAVPVEKAIEICLADQPFDFAIINTTVVIRKKEHPVAVSSEVAPIEIPPVTIRGRVTDEHGNTLPGTTVRVKGSNNTTVANEEGVFTIEANTGDRLEFSFVGFETREIAVTNAADLQVILKAVNAGLSEVVVVGYGTRKKRDVTGAVSQINSEEISKRVTMSPEFAMQGKMAGVYVSNPGSSPNGRPSIRIRGVSTLGYNEPLYVVDGIPLTEGGASSTDSRMNTLRGWVNVLNMINPNDIESISVLKDASATAIYGVRASNGVILITTKRGSEGRMKVNATASFGIQNIYKSYDVVSMDEYVAWTKEAWANNPTTLPNADYAKFYDPSNSNYLGNSKNYSRDWRKAVLVKDAPIQDYNLSITGGNNFSNYALGAGFASQSNAMWKGDINRFSFFLNSDHRLNKFFKVGESYRFVYSKAFAPSSSSFNTTLETMLSAPWQPVYDENGPNGLAVPGRTIDGKFLPYGYGGVTRTNFLGSEYYSHLERNLMRNMGSFYSEFSPLKGLRFRGTFSFDTYNNISEGLTSNNLGLFLVDRGTPYVNTGDVYSKSINENVNIVKEFLINYAYSFDKHNIDLVLNAMDQKVNWNVSSNSINDNSTIQGWDQRRVDEGWPSANKNSTVERRPSGLQGYMARLSYNYSSKYYLDGTVRRDGSSKFGPGHKWGTFPSFAAAWRISSESFMSRMPWINDLKIRGGWGKTGNQETRDYAYLSVVNFNPVYALGSGVLPGDGVLSPGAVLGDFPVEDMSWETVVSSGIGIDATILDNKFSFSFEYYKRLTDGILQTIRIPAVIGALSSPVVNLAKVRNSGIELQATYSDKIGPVTFAASTNFTTVKNVVEKLYEGQSFTSGNFRIEEGYSINYIYGYKTAGIFQTEAEVTAWKSQNTDAGKDTYKSPGDINFVDLYGPPTDKDPDNALKHYEPDGKIDANDQTYLGKTIPGYYYGISIDLNYKSWYLNMSYRGVGDVQQVNTLGKQTIGGDGSNFVTAYRGHWTETNPSAKIPRAAIGDPSGNNRVSDRHVENAGFLRFQNWQVGYNFSGNFLHQLGFGKLSCYVGGSNMFVITPYTGLDPENSTTPTTFMIGANLSF